MQEGLVKHNIDKLDNDWHERGLSTDTHWLTDSPRSASLNLIPRLRTGPRPEISPNDILIPCDKLTEKLRS